MFIIMILVIHADRDRKRILGHCFLVISINLLGSTKSFDEKVEKMIDEKHKKIMEEIYKYRTRKKKMIRNRGRPLGLTTAPI